MSYYNPRWQRAIQNQSKSQGKTQQQQPKNQIKDGFDPELIGHDVETEVVKGMNVVIIKGKVVDVSKYWLKLLVNNEIVHLNKAFVISIKPLIIKDGGVGVNAGK